MHQTPNQLLFNVRWFDFCHCEGQCTWANLAFFLSSFWNPVFFYAKITHSHTWWPQSHRWHKLISKNTNYKYRITIDSSHLEHSQNAGDDVFFCLLYCCRRSEVDLFRRGTSRFINKMKEKNCVLHCMLFTVESRTNSHEFWFRFWLKWSEPSPNSNLNQLDQCSLFVGMLPMLCPYRFCFVPFGAVRPSTSDSQTRCIYSIASQKSFLAYSNSN